MFVAPSGPPVRDRLSRPVISYWWRSAMVDRVRFVDKWSDKLASGTASVFVGAGTSMSAGYPSWKKLLSSIAQELGLDVEQEYDLAAVAQFYINRERGRGRLTHRIAKQLPARPVPSVLRLAARLPLRRVWTTNWDELIENALRAVRRERDVKERTGDLSYDRPDSDVTVYKMHGSVRHLDDIVLATDDFELYRVTRAPFLQVLAGHLISTSFLFIGVSFTDPNLVTCWEASARCTSATPPKGLASPTTRYCDGRIRWTTRDNQTPMRDSRPQQSGMGFLSKISSATTCMLSKSTSTTRMRRSSPKWSDETHYDQYSFREASQRARFQRIVRTTCERSRKRSAKPSPSLRSGSFLVTDLASAIMCCPACSVPAGWIEVRSSTAASRSVRSPRACPPA